MLGKAFWAFIGLVLIASGIHDIFASFKISPQVFNDANYSQSEALNAHRFIIEDADFYIYNGMTASNDGGNYVYFPVDLVEEGEDEDIIYEMVVKTNDTDLVNRYHSLPDTIDLDYLIENLDDMVLTRTMDVVVETSSDSESNNAFRTELRRAENNIDYHFILAEEFDTSTILKYFLMTIVGGLILGWVIIITFKLHKKEKFKKSLAQKKEDENIQPPPIELK